MWVVCPSGLVSVVCSSLPDIYVEKLLGFIATCLEKSGHLQFYMTWAQNLLMLHGQKLKNRCVLRLSFTSQIQFSMTVSEQKMTATNFSMHLLWHAGLEPSCPRCRRYRRASRGTSTTSPSCKLQILWNVVPLPRYSLTDLNVCFVCVAATSTCTTSAMPWPSQSKEA